MLFRSPRNGFDKMFGLQDYPPEKSENEWGVNDEFLFDFALNKIDSMYQAKGKFFATILTISTHPPQQFPKQTSFKPHSKAVFDQVFEYADYSLQNFFHAASKQAWFDSTLFVLVGDHGVNMNDNDDAPLSLNYVPLMFFMPGTHLHRTDSSPAMQMDLFPTALTLAGLSFENNTMGINISDTKRAFAFFTQDNRLCILNDSAMLVIHKAGADALYNYKSGMKPLSIASNIQLVDSMKRYAYSILQTTQWMQQNNSVGIK